MLLNNILILQDATPRQLEQAAAHNHIELFSRNALSTGGEVQTRDGLSWTYSSANQNSMIPFPSLTTEHAAEQLNDMMNWFRAHPSKGAGCWTLDPPQPADLGILLLARGFQPGWRPCWMAIDLETIKTDFPVPGNLQVHADNNISTELVKNLPYAGDNGAVLPALMKKHPEWAQQFIATQNESIVGLSAVHFTNGPYGVAGIYNVGVVPRARNKGIGKAVTIAACLYAKEKGYRYAVLNATYDGRRIYEQIGFKWLSDGCTWWLMGNRYITHPPSQEQVAIAEATGKGDIDSLNRLHQQFAAYDLNDPLTNRMTLMQLAVHCKQPASAEWLVQHGATYSVLDAWDIGWKDKATALLKANPELVNHQYGDWNTTLLHTAAERDDIALAQLALQAKPDLTLKDSIYDGTALGWAQHLQRKEIVKLIGEYQDL